MGYFKDADEVYAVLGKLFEDISLDDELAERFRAADTILRYEYFEPEATITLRLRPGEPSQVDFGPSEMEPEVTMSMDADTGHLFWLGKINVSIAMARGQIKADGPVAKILKLVPLTKPVFPRYRAQLAEQGLTELAEA